MVVTCQPNNVNLEILTNLNPKRWGETYFY